IARHLDRISDADVHALYSTLALQAWKYNPETVLAFHSDTTSKSVYGAYPDPKEGDLLITEGYSRDRQGDKQFQYGLIVDGQGRPVYGDVHDGNQNDKSWNPEVLKALDTQLKKINLQGFIYVADSAAMTRETLEQAKQAKAYLITRGGNNLKMVKWALEQADQQEERWSSPQAFASSNTSAQYRLQEFAADYEGHAVRLVVVESSALDKKKAHTLEKRVSQEHERITEAMKALGKIVFHCEHDAQTALGQWRADHPLHFHQLDIRTEAYEEILRPRGRPKKEAVPEIVTRYRLAFHLIVRDEDAIGMARRKASRFVLVSTVPNEFQGKSMDSAALLQTYKGQIRVECNFSILKDPYFVDEIYLKKPHRVEVLGYLFLIALLVYHTIQGKVRSQTSERHPLIATTKRKLAQPTTREIFRLLQYVQVVVFLMPDGSRYRQLGRKLEPEERRLLSLFGYDESIYI
ncbi:IS1634 family transposase, partial [Paenibacillus sp. y28]|uniref:IS1634 family transposase n=1 Tax=Paenibacillus sp. y28 TaxID=3129110 RepID=UPI0030165CA7